MNDINRIRQLAGLPVGKEILTEETETKEVVTENMREDRLSNAMHRIRNGEVVDVMDAGWALNGVAIGDFEEIGWAKRLVRSQGGFTTLQWQWNGPGRIRVSGQVLQPGDKTEGEPVNYSAYNDRN